MTKKRSNNNNKRSKLPSPITTLKQNAASSVVHVRVLDQQKRGRELKYFDISSTNYEMDTTGSVTLLNPIAEGNDSNNRNGRQVLIKGVQICGNAFATITTGLQQLGRVILIWDNATNGVLPVITDVLNNAASDAHYNLNNRNRFTILWDHQFQLDVSNATYSRGERFSCDVMLNAIQNYNNTGGTIANIQSGALVMLTIGLNAAGATAGSSNIATRVLFQEVQ
jgi:hypothetical protein